MAKQLHPALVAAGGDPVAYYELEQVVLSEEIQAAYAQHFQQRMIRNIAALSRKSDGEFVLNIMEFSGNRNMIHAGDHWSVRAGSLTELEDLLKSAGEQVKTKNLLVLDVPAFLPPLVGGGSLNGDTGVRSLTGRFLAKNPLNLDVFKLGIPLSGASGEEALLTRFRYDLIGKSVDQITAAQKAERASLESIFSQYYPYETVFLTEIRSDEALIKDKVQFVLMRVEGREGDLMESMGLDPGSLDEPDRIVVKYYIKFLVRNELYLGPTWDASPDGKEALTNFLKNLQVAE
ncbi:hypothetical protein GCM10028791_33800 [Echinicola sediminis]